MSIDVATPETRPLAPATAHVEAASPLVTFAYRAISPSAVWCCVLGALSVLTFFDWWMAIFPAAGILFGLRALSEIRRRPDELTGAVFAKGGLALSLVLWAAGWSWLGYQYVTEVPEGYQRIGYQQLQPDPERRETIPAAVHELNGKQVFIKGFVYPTITQHGINEFLLVRDSGTCCFGGNPKLTDRIQVKLADGATMSYSASVQRLAGVFRVQPVESVQGAADVPSGVVYHLDQAVLR